MTRCIIVVENALKNIPKVQEQAPIIATNLVDVKLIIAPAIGPPKLVKNNIVLKTTAAPWVVCPIASNASPYNKPNIESID